MPIPIHCKIVCPCNSFSLPFVKMINAKQTNKNENAKLKTEKEIKPLSPENIENPKANNPCMIKAM